MSLRLYSAPRTRALRVAWLLEELALPYELVRLEFKPTKSRFFVQDTPTGKIPTLEDGDVVMCESGAIVQYLLERYGPGGLVPAAGTPEHARYLQWLHFAEATAFPPLGVLVWLLVYRDDAARHPELVADARARAERTLAQVETALAEGPHLAGREFTAADVMMGFTLLAARALGLVGEATPRLAAYLDRLLAREACRRALERVGGF